MSKNLLLYSIASIIVVSCHQSQSQKSDENQIKIDSVAENEAMLEFSSPDRDGNRGDESDSISLEEFNNSDYGAPGIEDTWRDTPTNEEQLFFNSLKRISSNPNLFAFDSIPFITTGQGIYAGVEWLKEPTDLFGIDEFILLFNSNSSFIKDKLRLNDWYFESDCQLDGYPDGIYNVRLNSESNPILYPYTEEDKELIITYQKKFFENKSETVTAYYFVWTDKFNEQRVAKIHTVKVDSTLKFFAASNFICGG